MTDVAQADARGMKVTLTIMCIVATTGLSICIAIQRQASWNLERENNSLRQRLSQMDKLEAENLRLLNLVAEANGFPSQSNRPAGVSSAMNDPSKELVRLRGEVEALREQSKEIETLRANTREVRAATETALKPRNADQAADIQSATPADGTGFELLRADYGTDKTNLDVTAELRERIRGGGLKAIASNNLKGDPEFGQVKHLTVVYRFGGVTMTNEFHEGEYVVLPKEQEQ